MVVSEHGREAQGPFPSARMAETVEPEGRDSKAPASAETPRLSWHSVPQAIDSHLPHPTLDRISLVFWGADFP